MTFALCYFSNDLIIKCWLIATIVRVFDRDRNGFISADELRHQVTTVGDKLTQDEVTDLLRVADQNGDGLIDYKEVRVFKQIEISADFNPNLQSIPSFLNFMNSMKFC